MLYPTKKLVMYKRPMLGVNTAVMSPGAGQIPDNPQPNPNNTLPHNILKGISLLSGKCHSSPEMIGLLCTPPLNHELLQM